MGGRKRGKKCKYNIKNFKIKNKFGKIKANPGHTYNNVPPSLLSVASSRTMLSRSYSTCMNRQV